MGGQQNRNSVPADPNNVPPDHCYSLYNILDSTLRMSDTDDLRDRDALEKLAHHSAFFAALNVPHLKPSDVTLARRYANKTIELACQECRFGILPLADRTAAKILAAAYNYNERLLQSYDHSSWAHREGIIGRDWRRMALLKLTTAYIYECDRQEASQKTSEIPRLQEFDYVLLEFKPRLEQIFSPSPGVDLSWPPPPRLGSPFEYDPNSHRNRHASPQNQSPNAPSSRAGPSPKGVSVPAHRTATVSPLPHRLSPGPGSRAMPMKNVMVPPNGEGKTAVPHSPASTAVPTSRIPDKERVTPFKKKAIPLRMTASSLALAAARAAFSGNTFHAALTTG